MVGNENGGKFEKSSPTVNFCRSAFFLPKHTSKNNRDTAKDRDIDTVNKHTLLITIKIQTFKDLNSDLQALKENISSRRFFSPFCLLNIFGHKVHTLRIWRKIKYGNYCFFYAF